MSKIVLITMTFASVGIKRSLTFAHLHSEMALIVTLINQITLKRMRKYLIIAPELQLYGRVCGKIYQKFCPVYESQRLDMGVSFLNASLNSLVQSKRRWIHKFVYIQVDYIPTTNYCLWNSIHSVIKPSIAGYSSLWNFQHNNSQFDKYKFSIYSYQF